MRRWWWVPALAAVSLVASGGAGATAERPVPPVAALPSLYGPDGPPMPLAGPPPPVGPNRSQRTSPAIALRQDRGLLSRPQLPLRLTRAISDSELLRNGDRRVRALALQRTRAIGASVVRVTVNWSRVVRSPPHSGFDAASAADPAYDFASVDAAVRDATSAGLAPLLVVSHAPSFAEEQPRWPYALPGSWAPDPHALAAFATALATRYDGSFSDPLRGGRTLPRVRYLQVWNEPNLPRYLQPQWVAPYGRWTPFAPSHYRAMLNAFYAAVKAVRRDVVVVAAGLAPVGEPQDGLGRMTPVRFLNAFLCLQPPPRSAPEGCSQPPHFDVLALHPLSVGDPDRAARSSLDVAVADIAKVTAALRAAQRAGLVLPRGRKPLWVTELNWQSRPPSATGVPARLQAHWIARALHRLWVAGADLVAWQFLEDPALRLRQPQGEIDAQQRPAGLYLRSPTGFAHDTPKAFLRGFRFPFDPLRRDRDHIVVWGLVPSGVVHTVKLERRSRGRWAPLTTLRPSRAGMVFAIVALRGAADLRLAVAGDSSAAWRVPA